MELELKDKLFQDMPENEREDNLSSLCDKVIENHAFGRRFTKDDRAKINEEISENTANVEDKEDLIKEITKPLRDEIKSIKKLNKKLIHERRKGEYDVKEDVYMFHDEKTLTAHIYDNTGIRISIRPLTPEEKQRVLFKPTPVLPMEKTGTSE